SLWEEFFLPPGYSRRVPGLGSGFVYDRRGSGALVLTNEHVIRSAERIKVTLPDGRDFDAELVGRDEVADVAVLRIEGEDLPVAPLGSSRGLLIGEWTVAIGNPFGYLLSNAEPTVTAGVVSAVDRHIIPSSEGDDGGVYLGMIQTDAPINPGNSGGPLVNALGEVIGVNTSIFSRSGGSQGMGFAIPIDRAVRIAFDLASHGEVRRAWTGMDVEPVEGDAWGRTRGVRVSRVAPDSPADRAGIEEGDRLLAADGRRLANALDVEALLLDIRAGDEITVRIEGREEPVTLETEPLPSLRAERIRALEDLELITVTPQVRAERGLASESGALIVGVSAGLSRQLGIVEGDVIVQINNTRIRTAEGAATTLRAVAGTGTVRLYFERNGGLSVRTFYWGRR
ncbi:MAG TPA: trypsin-like peptidase domain-containing protein, partial [Longimicrobiales bacterium]|nr:trypsin-like peptidase domain-containing protein [Longimicrobiales bacterium]